MEKITVKVITSISWWVKPAVYAWFVWRTLRDGRQPEGFPAWAWRGIKTKAEIT